MKWLRYSAICVGLCAAGWAAWVAWVSCYFVEGNGECVFSPTQERLGQFGDSFGLFSSLGTIAALVFTAWSVLMQSRELQRAREQAEKQTRLDAKLHKQQSVANQLSALSVASAVYSSQRRARTDCAELLRRKFREQGNGEASADALWAKISGALASNPRTVDDAVGDDKELLALIRDHHPDFRYALEECVRLAELERDVDHLYQQARDIADTGGTDHGQSGD